LVPTHQIYYMLILKIMSYFTFPYFRFDDLFLQRLIACKLRNFLKSASEFKFGGTELVEKNVLKEQMNKFSCTN